jgi:hypothetical protein
MWLTGQNQETVHLEFLDLRLILWRRYSPPPLRNMKLSVQLLPPLRHLPLSRPPRPVHLPRQAKRHLRRLCVLIPTSFETQLTGRSPSSTTAPLSSSSFSTSKSTSTTSESAATEIVKIVTLTRMKSASRSTGGDAPSTISSSEDLIRSTALSSGTFPTFPYWHEGRSANCKDFIRSRAPRRG